MPESTHRGKSGISQDPALSGGWHLSARDGYPQTFCKCLSDGATESAGANICPITIASKTSARGGLHLGHCCERSSIGSDTERNGGILVFQDSLKNRTTGIRPRKIRLEIERDTWMLFEL